MMILVGICGGPIDFHPEGARSVEDLFGCSGEGSSRRGGSAESRSCARSDFLYACRGSKARREGWRQWQIPGSHTVSDPLAMKVEYKRQTQYRGAYCPEKNLAGATRPQMTEALINISGLRPDH
jgi:hypothetical protein